MFQALRSRRLYFLTLLVLLAAAPLAADDTPATAAPWDAGAFLGDPAEMLRAATSASAGVDADQEAVVLLAERRYVYDEQGRLSWSRRMVYRVQSANASAHWTEVSESWSPWYQEQPQLKARVIAPDGTVHPLDPATIAESAGSAEPEMYEDSRVLRAPLPAIGVGAVVEIELTGRDTAPFFDRGTVQTLVGRFWFPVLHQRAVVEAPVSLPLHYVVRRLPEDGAQEEVVDGVRRLTLDFRGLAPLKDFEVGMPAEAWLSYVAFSTGASWSAVAQRYSEIVEKTIGGSDDGKLRSFLKAAGAPGKTPRESIDRILSRLGAEVRYTGVELGEGSIVPRPPADTLRHKFGDCKDKAVLLVALLRRLDIVAHVALLQTGEISPGVEETLPGMGGFNHAIVVVPGEPALWIDPTDRYARPGELPEADQGKLALIADPATTALVRTPAATAADNLETETREIFLSDMGKARIVETTELRGAGERDLRASYAAIQDEKNLRQSLASYVNSVYMTDKLGKIDHSDPADLSRPFRLRLEAEDSQRAITDMVSSVAAVFPGAALGRLPEELRTAPDDKKPRQFAYTVDRPFTSEIRYRVVPPAGFRPQPLPPARVRELGPASLSEQYEQAADGTISAVMRFTLDQRLLSAAEYQALRKAASEIWAEDGVLLHFDQEGEIHLAAGRVREALAEQNRLAALAPDKALSHLRIARALLTGGMGEAARDEARKAVKLEPGSAFAWRQLAWTLAHDEVGRLFGQGFDRAGALDAYRKAKELDPENLDARRNLAIVLEYDDKGRRYSEHADLDGAIAEYRAIKSDLKDESLDDNLVIDLLRAEHFAEARELLDSLDATDDRVSLRLVALAALEGAPAAAKEAERRLADREKRRSALDEAAATLIQTRHYAEAAALLEQASRQGGNAAELLGRAELLRKARRHEELNFPATEPAGLLKGLLLAMGSGEATPETFLGFLSRGFREEIGADEESRRSAGGIASAFVGALEDNETRRDVALDLGLAASRETVTGDDDKGYRVTLSMALTDQEVSAYLVREDGQYRFAGFSDSLYLLGLEALLRLERGDLAGARQWLDWAREKISAPGGDDPLTASPFGTLWTRGVEASADDTRCAAASLLARKDPSARTVPILLSCREAAPEGPRRTAFDLALTLAYMTSKRHADALETAQRLAAAYPDSQRAYRFRMQELDALGRRDEMRQVAEERLKKIPDDAGALFDLSDAAERQGDLEAAGRYLQRVLDRGPDSTAFNNLAWQGLFRGGVDDKTVEMGQRAVTLDEYKNPSSLHTLACLYAELGRTAEAYQLILQTLEVAGTAPKSDEWYVFGRLAEHYGLPDAARRYYARVEPVKAGGAEAISTHTLAQQRLAALGPEGKAAKPGRQKTR
jgi:tetratricopeptide (TPR) repeat protein/transglutaminase-like putative cysteine protease